MPARPLAALAASTLALGAASCARAPAAPAPCAAVPRAAAAAPTIAAPARPRAAPSAAAFDPAPWLDDLHALIDALSSHYANLDYAVHERRMDLPGLRRRAEERLRAATSDARARRVLESFLRAFGDGHLSIDWDAAPAAPQPGAPRGPLCARLGFEPHEPGGVELALAGDYAPIADADADDVPGGVLTLPGRGKLGVLRIGLFTERAHPALCEAARRELGIEDDAACDDACETRMGIAAANLLTGALERRAASLAHAGAVAVVVDITGNGGGDDWVDPAVRALTPAHIPVRPLGVVRHPHWTEQLTWMQRELEADLAAHGDLPGGPIAAGIAARKRVLAEVGTPCDQRGLWEDGQPKPSCTQLVVVPPILPYAAPGALAGRDAASDLFGPSDYAYHEGANRLPLVVLVDGWTASAAEHFSEMLQDAHAAKILGAETLGSGCGFTNGGIPTVLPRSGARVRIPDCARLRADGSDAVAGVTPDIVLPLLERDSRYQRATKVVAGLASSWGAIVAPAHAPP